MYKHILIPTDGSEQSMKAIRRGIQFARSIGAKVTALHATPEFPLIAYSDWGPIDPITEDRFQEESVKRAEALLGEVATLAKEAGVECETIHRISDHPYDAIIKVAEEKGCDLIFMASHGHRGFMGVLMGSETTKVLTHTNIPVLVHRCPPAKESSGA